VVASIVWVIASIFAIFYGIHHCRATSYSYNLRCDATNCVWSKDDRGILETLSLSRYDFLDAEAVRINSKGEYVDGPTIKKFPHQRYGMVLYILISIYWYYFVTFITLF